MEEPPRFIQRLLPVAGEDQPPVQQVIRLELCLLLVLVFKVELSLEIVVDPLIRSAISSDERVSLPARFISPS